MRFAQLEASRLRAAGGAFARVGDHEYTLDPADAGALARLAQAVCASNNRLAGVVDCWSAAPPGTTDLDVPPRSYAARTAAARPAHEQPGDGPPAADAARRARRRRACMSDDALDPPRALGAGTAKVIPQEYPGLRVAHVDVDADARVAEHARRRTRGGRA